MAIDIIARGLATSLIGADGKVDSSKMPVLGEVPEGTTFYPVGQLSNPDLVAGKTAEEILLMMLYGIVTPTLTEPSLNIALSADNEQLIIGRPTVLKGALTFSRGKIDPAFGTSGYRAGAPIAYYINGEEVTANGNSYDFELEVTPTDSEFVINCSVKYGAGEQPVNSIGQPFGAPLAAGSIASSVALTAAQPIYNDEGEHLEFIWFKDEEEDGQGYQVAFLAETASSKQHFMLLDDVTVIGIKSFDPMTQQWTWLGGKTAAVSLTHFDVTVVTNENGDYLLYTHNQPRTGARELRIYVS